jgi:two-component system sensor histidine kinase BaeS
MPRSITTKLILAFLLLGVLVLALASGITYWLTAGEFRQLTYDQARGRFVADVTYYYETHGSWQGVLVYYEQRNSTNSRFNPPPNGPLPGPAEVGPRPQTLFFALADQDGRIVIPAGPYRLGEVAPPQARTQGTAITVNNVDVGTALVVGSPPPLGGLEQHYLSQTNRALLYSALGGLALALAFGTLLARALTQPVRELTRAIRSMAGGELRQSVPVTSKDELGELASAFNQMSADLDRLQRARRQMTADIAHDLRNPLTVIAGYIESMQEGVLKPTPERLDVLRAEVRHLQRLVEDLRTLSQAESGELGLNREPVNPGQLLERMRQSYQPLAAKDGIQLRVMVGPKVQDLIADPDRLAQVLGNLISNSLRYTPAKGEIVLGAWQDDGSVVLTVTDNGRGIPADALPYIFDRFYRADSARAPSDESGLGLAIARSIVLAHGGSISAESAPGTGTTMKITLPAG